MARKEFSKRTKREAFARSGGFCESADCGMPFSPSNPVEYDHVTEAYFDGDNSLENCKAICKACHKAKTRKQAPVIAKSRRIRETAAGVRKKKGFYRPAGVKFNWQSGRYEKV